MKKISFLIPTLTGGGAERVIVTLLRYLDRSKFRLTLIVIDMHEAVFLDSIPADVDIIDLNCSRVRYSMLKIISLIWKLRPDVVFSTLGHLNIALAIMRPFLPNGIRYIARETTIVSEGLKEYANPTWWAYAYRNFYDRFDLVICQSKYMRDDLVENFRLPDDLFLVINNPVDVEAIYQSIKEFNDVDQKMKKFFRNDDNAINIVAAGRMVAVKGFDLLIEAMAICKNPHLRLTLLGAGPLQNELEVLAQDRGVAKQIFFAGFQKNPYVFFYHADAYVLSSRFEGFPNVVVEALTCGTPVIAVPAPGGVIEILDGVVGCAIAQSVSAQSLAAEISAFVRGQRIPTAVIEPYLAERIADKYTKVFLAEKKI